MVTTSSPCIVTSFHPLQCQHLVLRLSGAPMNPRRATLDPEGPFTSTLPLLHCCAHPHLSALPSLAAFSSTGLNGIGSLQNQRCLPTAKKCSQVSICHDRNRESNEKVDKCVPGPGSYLALLTTTTRIPQRPPGLR